MPKLFQFLSMLEDLSQCTVLDLEPMLDGRGWPVALQQALAHTVKETTSRLHADEDGRRGVARGGRRVEAFIR
jgi:hypothetical protein